MQKRNLTLKIIVGMILLFACILASVVVSGVQRSAWTENAERNVHGTAILIQAYRDETGSLPKALPPVFDNSNFPTAGDLRVILGGPGCRYDYKTFTNGFALAVVRDAGLFHTEWKVSQLFTLSK